MNKFYGLVIMPDLSLKRVWMDNAIALEIIKTHKGCKIYRSSNDQEAFVVEVDGKETIAWSDVANVDKI